MIFLRNSQIREYAEEQAGTSFLRRCLLRICRFCRVFVAPQTTNTQKRIFGPCQPHICSRLPLLTTDDGSKLSKFSRRYSCLTKKINTMAAEPPVVWACPACSYAENVHGTMCEMCLAARPRISRSVLLVEKNSTHPAAVAARGGRKARPPPKARGVVPSTRESPARGAKDKANARMADQLGVVPMAEVVHSPESSPDGPLVPPPAAARRAGAVDLAAEDSDSIESPAPPSRGRGRKTMGEDPTFSPNDDPESPTDNEVSKYSFVDRLTHYMDGNKISEATRAAVEVCISVEAGAAVRSMCVCVCVCFWPPVTRGITVSMQYQSLVTPNDDVLSIP